MNPAPHSDRDRAFTIGVPRHEGSGTCLTAQVSHYVSGMRNTMTATILALPQFNIGAERPLAVGDLVVWTDYKGRKIGCTIARGTVEGHHVIRVVGDQAPYRAGFRMAVEPSKLARAI